MYIGIYIVAIFRGMHVSPVKHNIAEECMCRLWNITMRDYQESVTTGQTDG